MNNLVHMRGAGNTFVVATHNSQIPAEEIREIVSRKDSGLSPAEGVLILRNIHNHGFDADFYNPDGSHGMMCGNGSRCIVRYALDNGVHSQHDTVTFTLNTTPYLARVLNNGLIEITMPPPVLEHHYAVGELEGIAFDVYYVDVNSQHVVLPKSKSSDQIIHQLRYHRAFPRGTNVNMVTTLDEDRILLETFERGVEAITQACGTGAVSSAIAHWRLNNGNDIIHVIPPSGSELIIGIQHNNQTITALTLTGDAVYESNI